MSGEQHNDVLEPRVCLPKPDISNITVLTQSLPNEPILPWHHFDSPWLDQEAEGGDVTDEGAVRDWDETGNSPGKQLSLPLEAN
jgi:hypothetical protein